MTKLSLPYGRLTSCETTLLLEMRGVPFDSKPIRLEFVSEIVKRVSARLTDAFSTFIVKPNPVNFSTSCRLPLPTGRSLSAISRPISFERSS